MKCVVVTGASTGIGWGIAKVLVAKGLRVFGSVRKPADAERLAAEFGANFTPLLFDVTDAAAVGAAAQAVAAALGDDRLAGLVNNAGIVVPGPLLHLTIDEFGRQLDVNVTGQLIVTQAFAPLLGSVPGRAGAPGRIVMISSVSGTHAMPFIGAYSASKFALEALSESLRRELMLFGIDVVIVAPGAVATPIWDKAEAIDVARYADTPFAKGLDTIRNSMVASGRSGLKPERIGEAVWHALTAPRPKTRYVVTQDRIELFLVNAMPKRVVDRIIAGRLGLTRPQ